MRPKDTRKLSNKSECRLLTIEKRIAALESSASDDALKIILVEDGETRAAALERLGLSDARRVVYLTPLDALL